MAVTRLCKTTYAEIGRYKKPINQNANSDNFDMEVDMNTNSSNVNVAIQ